MRLVVKCVNIMTIKLIITLSLAEKKLLFAIKLANTFYSHSKISNDSQRETNYSTLPTKIVSVNYNSWVNKTKINYSFQFLYLISLCYVSTTYKTKLGGFFLWESKGIENLWRSENKSQRNVSFNAPRLWCETKTNKKINNILRRKRQIFLTFFSLLCKKEMSSL